MMRNYICCACGVQFAETLEPPLACPICEDDRQYVPRSGQAWTTTDELAAGHRNRIDKLEDGLYGIGTEPRFAIGQRAVLIASPHGNVLWDCISLLDEETVSSIGELGGVDAIAISHPHFYSAVVEWSLAFDAEVFLHEADRPWLMRPHERIRFWSGTDHRVNADVKLVNTGGHFPGSAVCHWGAASDGGGVLLTGDTIHVVGDNSGVSFMHSFPNLIPLPANAVTAIASSVDSLEYERLYGGWWGQCISGDAREVVRRSAARYMSALDDRARVFVANRSESG